MAKHRGLARDYKLEVNTADETTPVWVNVAGLQEITLNITDDTADGTDLDDGGWSGQLITGRGWNISATGIETSDDAGGTLTRDAGQAYLEGLSTEVGSAAVAHIRRVHRTTGAGYEGYAAVSLPTRGGNRTAINPFSPTLTGTGALTPVTGP